ncbi:hypothetical protein BC940DRAFT_292896 [Gongronella butleri]|nr:hypothetical protein BC940DRAFT_292896 [Gongronella butleri]
MLLPLRLVLTLQRYLFHRTRAKHRAFYFVQSLFIRKTDICCTRTLRTATTTTSRYAQGRLEHPRLIRQQQRLPHGVQMRHMASLASNAHGNGAAAVAGRSNLWNTHAFFQSSSPRFMLTPSTSSPPLQTTAANASMPFAPMPTPPVWHRQDTRHHQQQPLHPFQQMQPHDAPPTSVFAATRDQSCFQRYQAATPPVRGIADIVPTTSSSNTTSLPAPARPRSRLVHQRSQPPSNGKQNATCSISTTNSSLSNASPKPSVLSAADFLVRHDELSLQTTANPQTRASSSSSSHQRVNHKSSSLSSHAAWHLIIPLDITHDLLQEHASAWAAVSLSDPVCLNALHLWTQQAHQHVIKVTQFIQRLSMAASRMDAKFDVNVHAQSLCITLPDRLLSPWPLTRTQIHQWIKQIMPAPPVMQIKRMGRTHNPSHSTIFPTPDTTTTTASTSRRESAPPWFMHHHTTTIHDHPSPDTPKSLKTDELDDEIDEDDDLVLVSSMDLPAAAPRQPSSRTSSSAAHSHISAPEPSAATEPHDTPHDDDWVIGPDFQGVQSFLTYVDSLIDTSPAFSSRRFSA